VIIFTEKNDNLMPKTKTLAESKDSKTPVPTVQKQPETPEKKGGPLPGAPTSGLMMVRGQSAGAPGRARTMAGLQRTVGNTRISRLLNTTIQTKLTIGSPNDIYEQEAHRTAEAVMRMPESQNDGEGFVHRRSGNGLCPDCQKGLQRQPYDEEENASSPSVTFQQHRCPYCGHILQRQPMPNGEEETSAQSNQAALPTPDVAPNIESYLHTSPGGGQPLADSVRGSMETRFGQDFSQVRIHNDVQANEAASSLNAQAFTRGRDVYFGNGRYQPGTKQGQQLLSHELTHVLQQRKASLSPSIIRRWESKEHKLAGNRALIEFPYRGKINTNMTALRRTPRKDRASPYSNIVADLHIDAQVLAVASKGGWVRILVESGKATDKNGRIIKAEGLTGYVSYELITKETSAFSEGLKIGPGLSLSYGDFVAMGGDHFKEFTEISEEAAATGGPERLKKLRDLIDSEKKASGKYKAPEYESETTINEEYAERYKELALENIPHFLLGGTAMKTWQAKHGRAAEYAWSAGLFADSKSLELALAMNGFADHFLTDSFSAGHIRVPRKETIAFYQKFADEVFEHLINYLSTRLGRRIYELLERDYRRVRTFGNDEDRRRAINTVREQIDEQIAAAGGLEKIRNDFGLYLAGLFAKILHDLENEAGLRVQSKRHPEGWMAYGDKKMEDPANKTNLKYMLQSVQASKQDVVSAFNIGLDIYAQHGLPPPLKAIARSYKVLVKKVGPPYQATDFVPYPDPKAGPLPSWRWGSLDITVRKEILGMISRYLTTEVQEQILNEFDETQEVEVTGPNVNARPREAARDILNEFLSDPITFLEAAFGKTAS
jgi:hypothetical protein